MGLTRKETRVVETARDRLGLSYSEIVDVLGADESSLHRWRQGGRGAAAIFRRQLAALARWIRQMTEAFSDAEWPAWMAAGSPLLDGASPRDALMEGEFDRVAVAIHTQRLSALR